jgi:hypothetical protein
MTNRREFLQTGASVSALPLAGRLLPPDARPRIDPSHASFSGAVFDDRYAEGRSFGEAMRQLGVPVRGLANGDTTELWHDAQDLLRRKPLAAIAGTTQFGPMFVFEQLGTQRRMRVTLRVEHRVRGNRTIAHVMTGPPETLALAEDLRQRSMSWPALMAALFVHSRADASGTVRRTMIMPGSKPEPRRASSAGNESAPESPIHYYRPLALQEGHRVPWDGPLFSWVIAPAAWATGPSA